MKKIAVLFILFLSPKICLASRVDTVLFINLNNSFDEEAAARAGVKKSRRAFLTFPIAPQNILNQISELDEKIQAQLGIIGFDDCRGRLQQCEVERELLKQFREHKSNLEQPYKIDKHSVLLFLRSHSDKAFSSMIVSGSHGTGTFTGRNGKISDVELAEVVASNGDMSETLKSLHLMGCYSTAPSSLLNNWIVHFPQIKLITGYSQKAPRFDRPLGWAYLSEVLADESSLLKVCEPSELQKRLKKIKAARSMHTAIYACGAYAEINESYYLSTPDSVCESLNEKFNEFLPDYECYLAAEKTSCDNPPHDQVDNKLRSFYNVLQKISICSNLPEGYARHSRDQAVRLLFFDNVKKNFSVYYSDLLKQIDADLMQLNASDRIRFQALSSLSRREVLARLDLLTEFLEDTKKRTTQKVPSYPKIIVDLEDIHSKLKSILDELDPKCVPFSWVEPNEYLSSPCLDATRTL